MKFSEPEKRTINMRMYNILNYIETAAQSIGACHQCGQISVNLALKRK